MLTAPSIELLRFTQVIFILSSWIPFHANHFMARDWYNHQECKTFVALPNNSNESNLSLNLTWTKSRCLILWLIPRAVTNLNHIWTTFINKVVRLVPLCNLLPNADDYIIKANRLLGLSIKVNDFMNRSPVESSWIDPIKWLLIC